MNSEMRKMSSRDENDRLKARRQVKNWYRSSSEGGQMKICTRVLTVRLGGRDERVVRRTWQWPGYGE